MMFLRKLAIDEVELATHLRIAMLGMEAVIDGACLAALKGGIFHTRLVKQQAPDLIADFAWDGEKRWFGVHDCSVGVLCETKDTL